MLLLMNEFLNPSCISFHNAHSHNESIYLHILNLMWLSLGNRQRYKVIDYLAKANPSKIQETYKYLHSGEGGRWISMDFDGFVMELYAIVVDSGGF